MRNRVAVLRLVAVFGCNMLSIGNVFAVRVARRCGFEVQHAPSLAPTSDLRFPTLSRVALGCTFAIAPIACLAMSQNVSLFGSVI